MTWRGEVCKRCSHRNCIGFNVTNETWRRVVRGRWNILCPTCFDEEAELAGVRYRFAETYAVSWSDWLDTERPPSSNARLSRSCEELDAADAAQLRSAVAEGAREGLTPLKEMFDVLSATLIRIHKVKTALHAGLKNK